MIPTIKKRLTQGALTFVSVIFIAGSSIAQDVPAKLSPPADAVRIGSYAAKGVQIYVCTAANAWGFKAPEAQLTDAKGTLFAMHYAGPTWEAADGSKIVGKMIANDPAPTAGAVPWLLLSAQSSGQGVLAGVRFVQRLKTVGGAGPTGTCATPGEEQRAPYTAEYVFFR